MSKESEELFVGCASVIVVYVVMGLLIMASWNMLLAYFLEWPTITFWQGALIYFVYGLIVNLFKRKSE